MQLIMFARRRPPPDKHDIDYSDLHVAPWATQFRCLLARNFTSYWRNPEYNVTRFVVTLIIAFAYGSLFWRQGSPAKR